MGNKKDLETGPNVKKILLAAALFLGAVSLFGQGDGETSLTILYSSSLNGNLDGCDCKGGPRAGLVKRAAWLRALEKPEETLLVDVGDLLDPFPDDLIAAAIFDTYKELGYSAIALGDQELSNGIEALLQYRERYPLMAHNLTICPDETRCIFFSTTPLIVERKGIRIGIFALLDEEVFALYPQELKDKLKIADPKLTTRNMLQYLREEQVGLNVLLYHGSYENARTLAETLQGIDVLILGHEQRLIDAHRIGNTILASPGEEGNRLGILTLSFDSSRNLKFKSSFRLFSWEKDPDDPAVRKRIDEYKSSLRERLSSH